MAAKTDPAPQAPPLPSAILMTEDIGWMRDGSLVRFNDGQTVTDPADIAELVAYGAQFWEIK
jgi:hypothetical protein